MSATAGGRGQPRRYDISGCGRGRRNAPGFTLIELLIAISIVGILAAIAYPSYLDSITRTKRRTAETCLASYATHMERFYTSNLRYDQDLAGTAMNTAALQTLGLDCASAQNSGKDYSFGFVTGTLSAATYMVQATPTGAQATRDAQCGILSIDQTGARAVSGPADAAQCW